LNEDTTQTNCPFCQRSTIDSYILKETPHFRIITDYAPLVEGHLLIMPQEHYACYGTVPASLDTELHELKREVQTFFDRFYTSPAVFWEHGVFRQTVFHAHLHCFPFKGITYNLTDGLHDLVVSSQDDLRTWYASQGHYFYLEDSHHALLFSPDMDRYIHVIRTILGAGATAYHGKTEWRTSQQRQEAGKAMLPLTAARWKQFQQQKEDHAQ
jgi:diadenosine tetraphosphate (Ap4A) HIT family hydrolase